MRCRDARCSQCRPMSDLLIGLLLVPALMIIGAVVFYFVLEHFFGQDW